MDQIANLYQELRGEDAIIAKAIEDLASTRLLKIVGVEGVCHVASTCEPETLALNP